MEKCRIETMKGLQFIASRDQITHNTIVYAYENGCVDIISADRAIFRESGWEAAESEKKAPKTREKGVKSDGDDMLRSARRARAKLRRLALANEFEYFVTLTLDQAKIDRYDPNAIMKKVNVWLDNMVRRNGLRYILVPELHDDGAYHFHGFFAGRSVKAVDSGTIKRPGIKKPMRPRSEAERLQWLADGGMIVYNLPQWSYGFTTAIELYGEYSRAVGYVCKYIGKQEGQRPMGRWYYSGGALREPTKLYADLDYEKLSNETDVYEMETPGGKLLVIHTKMEEKNG
jgi:hypothetical protein